MSQYRKNDLKLHVRSNREVDETVVLRWSAEIATQWSQYEYLRGKIDIPIGTTTGTLAITKENFAQFIDPGKGSKIENKTDFYFFIISVALLAGRPRTRTARALTIFFLM